MAANSRVILDDMSEKLSRMLDQLLTAPGCHALESSHQREIYSALVIALGRVDRIRYLLKKSDLTAEELGDPYAW